MKAHVFIKIKHFNQSIQSSYLHFKNFLHHTALMWNVYMLNSEQSSRIWVLSHFRHKFHKMCVRKQFINLCHVLNGVIYVRETYIFCCSQGTTAAATKLHASESQQNQCCNMNNGTQANRTFLHDFSIQLAATFSFAIQSLRYSDYCILQSFVNVIISL
jgi:hypothetical protein